MAYSGKYEAESESTNEDMTDKELVVTYRILLTKWEKAYMEVEK